MKNKKEIELNFIVDKLTNSIENVISGDSFATEISSAPFNKGNTKVYTCVPGNLVAFACKLSFQRGHEGNVSFLSKSQLIDHYIKNLGAIHLGGRIMVIDTQAALKLINKYFINQ